MTKYTIKNRYTNKIIVEMEAESLREVVEKNRADLSGADLLEANLSGADLSGANLSGADLWRATFLGAKIKTSQKEDLLKALKIIIEE